MKSHIVVGLGYGDEGKGSFVDWLVRKYGIKYVVRFNGGSQAAHNVVTPEGLTHCFCQFGSGTLVSGTKTLLSHYMLVNPLSLTFEAEVLMEKGITDCMDRIIIDEDCPVITPINSLLNKIQEISRGDAKHGSCGCGVGLTQKDVEELGELVPRIRDLENSEMCRIKVNYLWKSKLEQAEEIATPECVELLDTLRRIDLDWLVKTYYDFSQQVKIVNSSQISEIIHQNEVVFEGAQGVLLDKYHGFYPHITRSNTGFENALDLLEKAGFDGEISKIGLLRGYSTRHGAGPFVTEDSELQLEPCHNQTNEWQGNFRLGWFDCVAAKYALEVVKGVDVLVLTNLDRMSDLDSVKICTAYDSFDGMRMERIPHASSCLEKLAERTEMLKKCKPVYQIMDDFNLGTYLYVLEQAIGRDVDAVSLSASAEGKSERIDFCKSILV